MNKQENRISSEKYFHVLPQNLNCAQAVLKGFQNEFQISEKEIEEYRAWGGGRAEGGVCGALFAAERLLRLTRKSCGLSVYFSQSKEKKLNINNPSERCSECLYFSIK